MVLLPFGAAGAPYQKITAEVPSYLPPGVKDSVLIVWGPPVAELPNQKVDTGESPVVWVKVRVGAKGRATDVRVVYSTVQDSAKIAAALKAAKLGLYYAAWNGPYPVEYEGYYPVVFYAFDYAEYSPNQPLRIYSATKAIASHWKKLAGFGSYKQADWKDIEIYVGRDAPVVAPDSPFHPPRPATLAQTPAEPMVWFRARIDRKGHVKSATRYDYFENVQELEKEAAKAVRKATFPIKKINDKPLEYDAYVAVPFEQPRGAFRKLGYPEPDDQPDWSEPPHTADPTTLAPSEILSRSGMEGTVAVRMLVSNEGSVLNARVDSSSGFIELDRLAIFCAKRLGFAPATKSDNVISAWTTVRLSFVATVPYSAPAAQKGNPSDRLDATGPNSDSESETLPKGEFVAVEVQPEMIKEVPPLYPREAMMKNLQGKVWVSVLVDKNGLVRSSSVARTSGHAALDSAAVQAARLCKYKPGKQNGKPVAVWVTYPVDFSINR